MLPSVSQFLLAGFTPRDLKTCIQYRVSDLTGETVLGICWIIIWMYLTLLNCTLKNGEDGKDHVLFLNHSLKNIRKTCCGRLGGSGG